MMAVMTKYREACPQWWWKLVLKPSRKLTFAKSILAGDEFLVVANWGHDGGAVVRNRSTTVSSTLKTARLDVAECSGLSFNPSHNRTEPTIISHNPR
jgi:hypothetical protein